MKKPNLSGRLQEAEFKEFEPWLKSAKTRFKLSASLNLKFDTILSGTNQRLKFKFGLRLQIKNKKNSTQNEQNEQNSNFNNFWKKV